MWGRKRKPETMSEIVDRVTRKYERRHGSGPARPLGPGEAAMMDHLQILPGEREDVRDQVGGVTGVAR